MIFLPRHGQSRELYLWIHYVLFPLVLAGSMLRHAAAKKKLVFQWPDLSMMAYLMVVVISVLLNGEIEGSRLQQLVSIWRTVFIPFVVYWLIRSEHQSIKDIGLLAPAMLVFCVMECAIGLTAWFRPAVLSSIWVGQVEQYGGPRLIGSLAQPDVYSGALVLFSVFVFQYAICARNRWFRIFCFIVFNISMFCVMLSYSRASWLAALVVLIVLASLYLREFLIYVLPGLIASVILLNTVLAPELDYASERFSTLDTIGNRVVSADAGVRMFLERPVFGWGHGTYDMHDHNFIEDVGPFKASEWDIHVGTSHNTYLTILVESGIIGFISYLFPFAWWLSVAVRGRKRFLKAEASNGFITWRFYLLLWSALFFFGIIGQFIDLRFFPFALTVQWFLLGILAGFTDQHLKPNE